MCLRRVDEVVEVVLTRTLNTPVYTRQMSTYLESTLRRRRIPRVVDALYPLLKRHEL